MITVKGIKWGRAKQGSHKLFCMSYSIRGITTQTTALTDVGQVFSRSKSGSETFVRYRYYPSTSPIIGDDERISTSSCIWGLPYNDWVQLLHPNTYAPGEYFTDRNVLPVFFSVVQNGDTYVASVQKTNFVPPSTLLLSPENVSSDYTGTNLYPVTDVSFNISKGDVVHGFDIRNITVTDIDVYEPILYPFLDENKSQSGLATFNEGFAWEDDSTIRFLPSLFKQFYFPSDENIQTVTSVDVYVSINTPGTPPMFDYIFNIEDIVINKTPFYGSYKNIAITSPETLS